MGQQHRRWAFRLAMICGTWDVDALLRRMPASLAAEWQAFLQLEPYGAMADDLRSAQICALLANINSAKGKTFSAMDFLPTVYQPPKKQTPAEMLALLEGMFTNGHKGH